MPTFEELFFKHLLSNLNKPKEQEEVTAPALLTPPVSDATLWDGGPMTTQTEEVRSNAGLPEPPIVKLEDQTYSIPRTYEEFKTIKGAPKEPMNDARLMARSFIIGEEGLRNESYPDASTRSVGYGFNMGNKDARKIFKDMGINYDMVYRGKQKITNAQAERLLDHRLNESNDFVQKKYGDLGLNPQWQATLMDLHYNAGPSIFGKDLDRYLKTGELEKAAQEIEERSNLSKNPVLAARRKAAAAMARSK
jgi:GH24 family phage-related lysozyme (muramidase)